MSFSSFIEFDKEWINVHFTAHPDMDENFKIWKKSFDNSLIIVRDTYTNLNFFSSRMTGPLYVMWPNKSFALLNGIHISVYNNDGILAYEHTHDFENPHKQTLYIDNKPVLFKSDEFDLSSWWSYFEVVIQDSYGFKSGVLNDSDIVVDIGANIGMFSLMAKKHGAKNVYAIEASPKTFQYLKHNTEPFGIKCQNYAISNNTGNVRFNDVKTSSGIGSIYDNNLNSFGLDKDQDVNFTDVKSITFDDWTSLNKIDYIDCLKIDCEGSEWSILDRSIDYISENVNNVLMELHPWGMTEDIQTVDDFKDYYNEKLVNKLDEFDITIEGVTEELTTVNLLATRKNKMQWSFKVPEEKIKETETVEIELSNDDFLKLAKHAHDQNITLNTLVNNVIKDKLKDSEYKFEHGNNPQFLTEREN